MKRRNLIAAWAGIAAGLLAGLAQAVTPCPPPQISVAGGSTATTACGTTSSAGTFSTNFPGTENPLSEGGNWIDGQAVGLNWNNPKTAPGRATASVLSGSPSRYNDSIAHLSSSVQTFAANQFAQGTVYLANGYSGQSHEVELLLRFSISANNAHGYEVMWGLTGYLSIVRWNGALGDYSSLFNGGVGSLPVPVDGDVLRAEIVGNVITVYRNGVAVKSVDVTSIGSPVWSAGQPGIGFWPVDSSTPANYGWKSYTAGNL